MSLSQRSPQLGNEGRDNDLVFENLLEVDAQMALLIKSITTYHSCEAILLKSVTLITNALVNFTRQPQPSLKCSTTLIALVSSGAVINILNSIRAHHQSVRMVNACLKCLSEILLLEENTTKNLSRLLISSGTRFYRIDHDPDLHNL